MNCITWSSRYLNTTAAVYDANTTRTSSNLNTTSYFTPCIIINTLIHGHREKSNSNPKKLTCSSFLCKLRCTLTQLLQSYKPNLSSSEILPLFNFNVSHLILFTKQTNDEIHKSSNYLWLFTGELIIQTCEHKKALIAFLKVGINKFNMIVQLAICHSKCTSTCSSRMILG